MSRTPEMGAKTSSTQPARPAGTCIPPLPPPCRTALANLCFHQTRNPLGPCPAPLNPSNASPPHSPRLPPPQGPFTPRLHTGRLLQARVHGSNSRPGTDLSGALSTAAQVRTAGTQEVGLLQPTEGWASTLSTRRPSLLQLKVLRQQVLSSG